MRMLEAYEMIEITEKVKDKKLLVVLAKNLKRYRMSLYEKYKKLDKGVDNPYSSENIASLLDISKRHYTRLENPNNISKNISVEKLVILSEIYGVPIDDFFKKDFE